MRLQFSGILERPTPARDWSSMLCKQSNNSGCGCEFSNKLGLLWNEFGAVEVQFPPDLMMRVSLLHVAGLILKERKILLLDAKEEARPGA